MIYLLWTAIVVQGAVTAWLVRRVWQLDGLLANLARASTDMLVEQSVFNCRVTAKLRALGQPID